MGKPQGMLLTAVNSRTPPKTVWLAQHAGGVGRVAKIFVCTSRSVFAGIKMFMAVIEVLSRRKEMSEICLCFSPKAVAHGCGSYNETN